MRQIRRASVSRVLEPLPTSRSSFVGRSPDPVAAPALPRSALWFFVLAPPVLAFLFDPGCQKDAWHLTRALIAIESFALVTGLAVHHAYGWLHARLKAWPTPAEAMAQAAFIAAVVLAVGGPQLPLITWIYPEASGAEISILSRAVLVALGYVALAGFVAHLQDRAVRERLRAHGERTIALESRLAALQAQMQPHFLFNTLNVCAGLVHTNPDAAERTVDRLASYLRYALESSERRLVPLDEELAAVASYLEVQRQRFGDRLQYTLSGEARDWLVPPMLLQPLVENAVLHGIQSVERGGTIRVTVVERGDSLVLTVDDDGVGPGASARAGTGVGHRNVSERLALTYGARAHFETGASPEGGFRGRIVLPESR